AFSTLSTRIAPLAVISISVLPNNQSTARPKSQQQQVFPTSKEKISATDAISTKLVASKLITGQPRNTSAAIHSSYSFSSPADSPGRFISTWTCVERGPLAIKFVAFAKVALIQSGVGGSNAQRIHLVVDHRRISIGRTLVLRFWDQGSDKPRQRLGRTG